MGYLNSIEWCAMGLKIVLLNGLSQIQSGLGVIDAELRIPMAIALGAIPGALCRYYLTRWCIPVVRGRVSLWYVHH
jgi:hypothetical protein